MCVDIFRVSRAGITLIPFSLRGIPTARQGRIHRNRTMLSLEAGTICFLRFNCQTDADTDSPCSWEAFRVRFCRVHYFLPTWRKEARS